ncbi:TRAP transporter substrate-binding protein DctP (plasmid) [Azospirillum oryzae]|uniref:TRAP transporter substrate-binding protein DctP n=1 Tax=Azospirillum oryzae TaxID=286727 RepID=A0A6N1AXS5_9PROT|nr:TRAP transporter substrate-binding protein DctP [Azospirillum oryzae]KAA0587838.1 C4-dicarboxylate ABC transporter [Azospirillum oryzae]QKS53954.1 TRAP transporter substrate-binding protein DctP [Azospirillum oryzae]GLR77753.1 C4-dicarboxylate ABC transporter [Azospirillum oryzae]
MKRIVLSSVAAVALAGWTFGAQAQSKVTLRVADSLPAGHIISETSTKPWIELVKTLSKDRIEIQYYPAEQVGKAKDLLQLTQAGMIDVGYVGPSYVSEKMPLSAVAELPGSFSSTCQVMSAYWDLASREGGYLYEHEFKPNKIRPLFIAALPPYQVVLGGSATVNSMADLAGKKLRASGGAQDLTLRKLDMVSVRMAPPEIYEAMSRGTIDGTLLSFVSVESYKLTDITKSATTGQNFGTVVVTYSIGDQKWRGLPKDVQDILKTAGDQITRHACQNFDTQEKAATERLKEKGVKFITFTKAEQDKIDAATGEVALDWAKSLDQRGKPGSETLKAFRAALAKDGQTKSN